VLARGRALFIAVDAQRMFARFDEVIKVRAAAVRASQSSIRQLCGLEVHKSTAGTSRTGTRHRIPPSFSAASLQDFAQVPRPPGGNSRRIHGCEPQ